MNPETFKEIGEAAKEVLKSRPLTEAEVANLTDQRISRHVLLAMRLVDGYFPALMNVIYRGTSPVQAVEQGEAEYAAVTSKGQEEEREA